MSSVKGGLGSVMGSIFDELPPYQRDSETSIEAARSQVGRTRSQRERVLAALKVEALTDEQLCERLKMRDSTVRPRRGELVTRGFVKAVGKRTGTSGRNMTVWGVMSDSERTEYLLSQLAVSE